MKIGIIKNEQDSRVALVPQTVKKLVKHEGITVVLEHGLSDLFDDETYRSAGATLLNRNEVLEDVDILIGVEKPQDVDLKKLKPKTLIISFLDLFENKDYLRLLVENNLSAIGLELVPRTTIAQKMDAISSQASLAGYTAVIKGASKMNKILPMMMTPSGTIKPAKVFIIGAGVAGLQAVATAKRLGANVIAFDTRNAVKEQVESLGGKFLQIDLGDTGETKGGYAKALTKEQLNQQQKEMTKVILESDLVITTAKLFGRKAPIIIKEETIKEMKNGSVIVDLAAITGGNVEGTVVGETVEKHGVTIVGDKELATIVNYDASLMLSNNIMNLILHYWNDETRQFEYKDDEILTGCLVVKDGNIVHEKMKEIVGG